MSNVVSDGLKPCFNFFLRRQSFSVRVPSYIEAENHFFLLSKMHWSWAVTLELGCDWVNFCWAVTFELGRDWVNNSWSQFIWEIWWLSTFFWAVTLELSRDIVAGPWLSIFFFAEPWHWSWAVTDLWNWAVTGVGLLGHLQCCYFIWIKKNVVLGCISIHVHWLSCHFKDNFQSTFPGM